MVSHRIVCRTVAVVCLVAVQAACGPSDPRAEVLEERARWTVTPKGYVETEDGRIKLSLGIAGPARSGIEQLSFRIDLRDASGDVLAHQWHTVDLSAIPMGTGTDISVTLVSLPEGFADISIDRVPHPTPEEAENIKELQF